MKIVLPGRIPSKKNSRIMICRGRYPMSIPNGRYTQWHQEMSLLLSSTAISKPYGFISLVMTFYLPDKRKTDLINKAESVLDLFVDNKIIVDDDWLCVNSLHLSSGGVDKENPRCEIEIIELEKILTV